MVRNTAEFPFEPTILGPYPPRSGELTPYAAKTTAQFLLCLASLVVVSTIHSSISTCTWECVTGIVLSGISLFFIVILIIFNLYRDLRGSTLTKERWFGRNAEVIIMLVFVGGWTLITGLTCCARITINTIRANSMARTQVFSWIALGSSLYAAYKVYHNRCEEEAATEVHYHYYDLRIGSQAGADTDEAQYR